MWSLFVLYILGLNVCQTTGEDNSTQMYYVKLTVEESAIANITLTSFGNTNLTVDDLKMTTICQSVEASTECSCKPDFRWSDRVCNEPSLKCCGNKHCTFTNQTPHMCVSSETVAISGNITLNDPAYYNCLDKNASEEFKQCNTKLLRKMKAVYSTLAGFDILTITKYRIGSVIAYFEISFANKFKQLELMKKSENLSRNLSASVMLETTGVVRLIMPPNSPVCYYDNPSLTCIPQEDLKTLPVWELNRGGTVFKIFNGTESVVKTQTLETKVTLRNISELWAGQYTCLYHKNTSFINIIHKASGEMDISLLSEIDITMTPAFPRCTGAELVQVRVKCEIESSKEMYNVTWTGHNIFSGPFEIPDDYASDVIVSCNKTKDIPQVNCMLRNRCNEERKASARVNVIYETDEFCAAEGEWEDTKAGFSAVLKCKKAAGKRERKCKRNPTEWEPEVSACVKEEVNNVLQKANIVDIGLGSRDENAANVFSLLGDVTNNSASLNTFADMNASVEVLVQLSKKIYEINIESSADNFLESSSNMLEKSLNNSWRTNADQGNISLAEKYLDSLEQLIQMINVTSVPKKKKNVELATSNCLQGSKCLNTVFNTNVVLVSSDPGNVKTAGLKELENYLPNNDQEYEPNSIIVSVTTENKQLDSVEVEINFSLIRPRPPHVTIKCVSWDNSTRSWSSEGCEWKHDSDEGVCVCRHLSSFAILMSKYPVTIAGLTELTLVGLSISVISLILTLAIELIVWSAVVKTDASYLRHTANVNICLCLLVADCCFLAAFKLDDKAKDMWCKIFVVLKHFCYLAMFFWMLCLSTILLHQAIFPFHIVGKKTYLRFSLVLGYVCPLLIAVITLLSYNNGAEGVYYSIDTCWLRYVGLLKGSIYTFVIPIGVIVFFNVFSMAVVIVKLLDNPRNTEKYNENEKKASVTVVRSVIILTPIFGLTWIFGFAVMLLDLTAGTIAFIVHYAFNLLNTFQGLFILLTTTLADKPTRDALLKHLKKSAPASTTDSTTKLNLTWNK